MAPRQQGASVMVSEYVYSPHVDFFIDRVDRDTGYEMASFHIHHKYEIYYELSLIHI